MKHSNRDSNTDKNFCKERYIYKIKQVWSEKFQLMKGKELLRNFKNK